MSEHDLEKLLGGFAADTLMPEERIRLYTAAMQDQQLFNAMADEQALKELLADPLVRRRLLQALQKPVPSDAGGSSSWWNWIRRPAGLALAGGVAVAIVAVAFGTKIYLETLDRAAQPVATEKAHAPGPQASPAEKVSDAELRVNRTTSPDSADAPSEHDARTDKSADSRKPVTPSTSREQRAERDEAGRSAGKRPAPSATATASKSLQAPAGTSADSIITPPLSARALFYGEAPNVEAASKAAQDRALQTPSESTSQARRPEAKRERFADANKSGATAPTRPLGLRYSFVIQGQDGQPREVDPVTAVKSSGPVRISVEASQDAFLQLLQNLGAAGTRLWWPPQETGKISLKIAAGKRTEIPLPPPAEGGLLSLTIRLSPKPFAPLTMQEVGMLDRFSTNLITEAVSPATATRPEQATYVVSPESSPTSQIAVEIPLNR